MASHPPGPLEEEWVDVVDEEGRAVDRATRVDAHRRGLRHPTAHVWVLRPHRLGVRVVFQWRKAGRLDFPALLDVTCGGHIRAGESADVAMRRELEEELGLKRVRVAPLGQVPVDAETRGLLIREWAHEYVHVTRRSLRAFRVAPEEVEGLLEAPLQDLKALHTRRADSLVLTGAVFGHSAIVPIRRSADRSAFVPVPDGHWADLWDRLEAAYQTWEEG